MKEVFLDDLNISNKEFNDDILENLDFSYKSLNNILFNDCKFYNLNFFIVILKK